MKRGFSIGFVLFAIVSTFGAEPPKTSFMPVVPKEPLPETVSRMKSEKPAVMKRQMSSSIGVRCRLPLGSYGHF